MTPTPTPQDARDWIVIPRLPTGKEHDAAWDELQKLDHERIRQRISIQDARALFNAIAVAMRQVYAEPSPKHNPELYVGDRLAFLAHALFMRGMNVEGQLINEAIGEMARLNGAVRALSSTPRGTQAGDADTDWHVVSEAVYDAINNCDGHISAKALENAFKKQNLIVLHTDPKP